MAKDYKDLLTELKGAEIDSDLLAKLDKLSNDCCDPLTGLLDFRSFSNRLQDELRPGRKLFVIAFAVDYLRELNLLSNRVVGDLAVCHFAEQLKKLPCDGFSARISGNRFQVFMDAPNLSAVKQWLKHTAASLASLQLPGIELLPEEKLTFSAGLFQGTADDVSEIMTAAKERLQHAINSGGNTITSLTHSEDETSEDVLASVTIQIRTEGADEDWSDAQLMALSLNGITMTMDQPVLVGEILDIRLTRANDETRVLSATVAWRKPSYNDSDNSFSVAASYALLEEEDQDFFESLMGNTA